MKKLSLLSSAMLFACLSAGAMDAPMKFTSPMKSSIVPKQFKTPEKYNNIRVKYWIYNEDVPNLEGRVAIIIGNDSKVMDAPYEGQEVENEVMFRKSSSSSYGVALAINNGNNVEILNCEYLGNNWSWDSRAILEIGIEKDDNNITCNYQKSNIQY